MRQDLQDNQDIFCLSSDKQKAHSLSEGSTCSQLDRIYRMNRIVFSAFPPTRHREPARHCEASAKADGPLRRGGRGRKAKTLIPLRGKDLSLRCSESVKSVYATPQSDALTPLSMMDGNSCTKARGKWQRWA